MWKQFDAHARRNNDRYSVALSMVFSILAVLAAIQAKYVLTGIAAFGLFFAVQIHGKPQSARKEPTRANAD